MGWSKTDLILGRLGSRVGLGGFAAVRSGFAPGLPVRPNYMMDDGMGHFLGNLCLSLDIA
jgi:hypothetical protein